MEEHELVSVVVPIYNVEPYLRRCLDSILAQDYEPLEVILVDDGSPDGCPAICDEYAAADERVRVIHQPNGGLSAARNAGIDVSRGEWLYFVDSDDWCEPHIVSHCMARAVEHDADMVIFDHDSWGHGNDGVVKTKMPEGTHTTYEALEALYEDRIDVGVWHILYGRHLFDDVRFPKGELSEDVAVQHLLIAATRCVYVLHEVGYHYMANEGSITATKGATLSRWWILQSARMIDYARQNHPELAPLAEACTARRVGNHANDAARRGALDELITLRSIIREHDLHPTGATFRTKVAWRMLTLSPRLFMVVGNAWLKVRDPWRKG